MDVPLQSWRTIGGVIALSAEAASNVAVAASTAFLVLAIFAVWLASWRRTRPKKAPAGRYLLGAVVLVLLSAGTMLYAALP
jgi:drug/metabolite transporter (DMT)-like permease